MTDAELDELQRLADAATKGPWELEIHRETETWRLLTKHRPIEHDGTTERECIASYYDGSVIGPGPNAILALEARDAVPKLIAEVRRLRKTSIDYLEECMIEELKREAQRRKGVENRDCGE